LKLAIYAIRSILDILTHPTPQIFMNIRIGNGYDIHRLVANRPLILGGVQLEHELGLLGHSDADVLTHAIMDAMLGALSLGDIGHYFPPTDAKWAGADSIELLKQVNSLIIDRGWQISNLDTVIVAERPKLKPHISTMRDRLAKALQLSPEQIGVKATTNEKLDATGREEGICAYAVVLLERL
jgi:2-C-methyl-D-erythritol 2,4-cyclodiphosphate synthase